MIEKLSEILDDGKSEIIQMRRELHQIPETEFEEFETAEYIMKKLDEMNIKYTSGIAKTGIKAVIHGGRRDKKRKNVLLRSDMDALPVSENTGLDFCSKNQGKMHACGHDGHMTILLSALRALNSVKEELAGDVIAVFQPAEEGAGGAKPMLESGAFDNDAVDYAFALHVEPTYNTNTVAVKDGPLMASPDEFDIEIVGRGGHGGYRNKCIDPIYAASQVVLRIIDAGRKYSTEKSPCTVSVGAVNGGTFYNVIPDSVRLKGTSRAVDFEKRNLLYEEIKKITDEVCRENKTEGKLDFRFMYPPLINNKEACDIMRNASRDIGNEVIELDVPFMGGEDFSYFAEKFPAAYVYVGCRNEEKDCIYPWHSPKFNMDEDCLVNGAKLICAAVVRAMEEKSGK